MEAVFEDLVTQIFPQYRPLIKTIVKCMKAANVSQHSTKMEHFSKFCVEIKNIDPAADDAFGKIVQAKVNHFDPYWKASNPKCQESPLDCVGGYHDNPEQVHKLCGNTIEDEASKMFTSNLWIQGGVILVEFCVIIQLALQAKLSHDTIKKISKDLKKIEKEYIEPAYHLMYGNKIHSELKIMSKHEIEKADLLLKGASDLLQAQIDNLEREKTSSLYNSIAGGVATFGALVMGVVWYVGWGSLSTTTNISVSAGNNVVRLATQQQVMTGIQSIMVVGLGGVSTAHLLNYKKCNKILQEAVETKKKVVYERQKLTSWIPVISRNK